MAMNQIKRLVICCDGTWMDSDDGFTKPTLFPYVPTGSLQIPSNVTRISRALRRVGLDGKPQIVYYHSGVGTGSSTIDTITGGFLGIGVSENIREVYSFIAANYTPGDEIVLIGFSRGAFTVRSVASVIRDIGLLTRHGMEYFYPIFKDQQNFRNERYNDIFPDLPFSRKPHGPGAADEYKQRLEKAGYTRVDDPNGVKIRVQAVAVWDTVGSLGIPNISFFSKLGLPQSTREYKFYDTSLSGIIRHAFQALALDEHRGPFQPAVWERKHVDRANVDLRQVWLPGAHSNIGGGYPDQEIANVSLAWMMDQLASIGVAFQEEAIDIVFQKTAQYYMNPPKNLRTKSGLFSRKQTQWAIDPIYEKHKPVRPFGLGEIVESETGIWNLAGKSIRTPGLYKRADPDTGLSTGVPMTHTNERIHSCVRIRLELEGLAPDDKGIYQCTALESKGHGPWRLRQQRVRARDPIPWNASWGPGLPGAAVEPSNVRWIWEYDGPEAETPRERVMIEENLGPYQRKLLSLSKKRETSRRRRKKRRKRRYDEKRGSEAPFEEKHHRRWDDEPRRPQMHQNSVVNEPRIVEERRTNTAFIVDPEIIEERRRGEGGPG